MKILIVSEKPSVAARIAVAAIGAVILVFAAVFGYVISNTLRLIIYDYMTDKSQLPNGWDKSLIEDAVKKRGGSSGQAL